MNEIYLTQELFNDDGYVDTVDKSIRNAVQGEPLTVLITCPGGDVYQGARPQRSIMQHDGHTKAVVIGLAASMAAVLLGAFDEVEIDEDAELMFHKAHIPGVKPEAMTPEQKRMCDRFNSKAYAKMLARGVDEDFLEAVFLSDSIQDYWLTAKEAEALGIGKVTKVVREGATPSVQVVNMVKDYILNNKSKTMGLFGKTKTPIARVATLADGRKVAFSSVDENITKGVTLVALDDKPLAGKVKLSNNMVAEVNEQNEVVNMEEMPAAPMEVEGMEKVVELESRVSEMEKALAEILSIVKGGQVAEPEMKAKEDAMNAKLEEANATLAAANEAATTIQALLETGLGLKSTAKLQTPNNSHERVIKGAQSAEERAVEMRNILNQK